MLLTCASGIVWEHGKMDRKSFFTCWIRLYLIMTSLSFSGSKVCWKLLQRNLILFPRQTQKQVNWPALNLTLFIGQLHYCAYGIVCSLKENKLQPNFTVPIAKSACVIDPLLYLIKHRAIFTFTLPQIVWNIIRLKPPAHAGSLLAVFFYPEDGGNTFLRNVGSHKIYTAAHPRRWQSS
jgi:hypothetical protein